MSEPLPLSPPTREPVLLPVHQHLLLTWGLLPPPGVVCPGRILTLPLPNGARLEIGGFAPAGREGGGNENSRNPAWNFSHLHMLLAIASAVLQRADRGAVKISFRSLGARLSGYRSIGVAKRNYWREVLEDLIATSYRVVTEDGRTETVRWVLMPPEIEHLKDRDGQHLGTFLRSLAIERRFLDLFFGPGRGATGFQLLNYTAFADFRSDLARMVYLVLPRNAVRCSATSPFTIGVKTLMRHTGWRPVEPPADLPPAKQQQWLQAQHKTLARMFEGSRGFRGLLSELDGAELSHGVLRVSPHLFKSKDYGLAPDRRDWDYLLQVWVEGRLPAARGKLFEASGLSSEAFESAVADAAGLDAEDEFLLDQGDLGSDSADRTNLSLVLLRNAKALLGDSLFKDILRDLRLRRGEIQRPGPWLAKALIGAVQDLARGGRLAVK